MPIFQIMNYRFASSKPLLCSLFQWPWMVSIQKPGLGHFCGGSIISKKFILTAAHCTSRIQKSDIKVITGSGNLGYRSNYQAERSVINIIQHPKFVDDQSYYDIALLELDQELTFSEHIFPICLPSQPNYNPDHRMHQASTLTGWGRSEVGGQVSPELRQAQLTIFSSSHCNASRWETNRYTGLNESSSSLIPHLFQSSVMCAGDFCA